MDSLGDTAKSLRAQGQDLADQAASAGKNAVHSAGQSADKALNKLSDGAKDLSAKAAPAIKGAASEAQSAVDSGLDYLRESWPEIRDWLEEAADRSIAYVKKEPLKASLMAVAAAVALLVLARSGRSRR